MKIERAWTYWEGPRPGWIDLCLESLAANIPGIEILTPESFGGLFAAHRRQTEALDLWPADGRLCMKSDLIRVWLLKTFGGMWVDADCIALRDLRELCEQYGDKKDFVAYRLRRDHCYTGIVAAEPDSRILAEWDAAQLRWCQRPPRKRRRGAVGPLMLAKAIAPVGRGRVGLLPEPLVQPYRWRAMNRRSGGICEPVALVSKPLPVEQYAVMLAHGAVAEHSEWNREEWLASDTWLGGVFRKALKLS